MACALRSRAGAGACTRDRRPATLSRTPSSKKWAIRVLILVAALYLAYRARSFIRHPSWLSRFIVTMRAVTPRSPLADPLPRGARHGSV
ncbi:MAG TPA: hypothetical protein VFP84_03835 [Kofleriaceae bacterium]|nr:hypothetical protein [Kofleriaceae bacterium]